MIIRSLLLLILFITFLSANNITAQIDKLNREIPYATKGETISILHKLENLYISAVISKDKRYIINSLKGIVRCRKLLHMNAKTYQRELDSLIGTRSKIIPLKKPTLSKKVIKKDSKKVLARVIKYVSMDGDTLVLKFNTPLRANELISFNSDSKNVYKMVYDIRANLNFKTPKLHSSLKRIKIAQNRDNLVRVVLEHDTKFLSKAFIRGGNLFIKISNIKKKAKKVKSTHIIVKHKENKLKQDISSSSKTTSSVYAISKVIVIDPGHGGHDSGAIGYKKHQEKKSVLKVAKLLSKMLKDQGYKVYMTRNNDQFVKLKDRTHMATRYNADLFISIHANAAPKGKQLSLKGIETFFLSPARTNRAKRVAAKENSAASVMDKKSKDTLLDFLNKNKIIQSNKLAIDIQSGMLESVRSKFNSVKDGGVREAPFWVLVGAQMPAVLVELGYITNPMEGDRLYNPFYQKSIAKGIFSGINNYFTHNR